MNKAYGFDNFNEEMRSPSTYSVRVIINCSTLNNLFLQTVETLIGFQKLKNNAHEAILVAQPDVAVYFLSNKTHTLCNQSPEKDDKHQIFPYGLIIKGRRFRITSKGTKTGTAMCICFFCAFEDFKNLRLNLCDFTFFHSSFRHGGNDCTTHA